MSEVPRKPSPISFATGGMVGVMVILFILCAGGAMLISYVADSREKAKLVGCEDRLRQLGAAVFLYEDSRNQLPAMTTGQLGWSTNAMLLPFMEKQETYLKIDFQQPSTAGDGVFAQPVRSFRLPSLICPARGARLAADSCQPTDYLPVGYTRLDPLVEENPDLESFDIFMFNEDPQWEDYRWGQGMILYPAEEEPEDTALLVVSRTSLSDIPDGAENTAMFVEKHLAPGWLGTEYDSPALSWNVLRRDLRVLGDLELARDPNTQDQPIDHWRFGSWHPGVCQILLGGGGVRTTGNAVDKEVLRQLGDRSDGTEAAPE